MVGTRERTAINGNANSGDDFVSVGMTTQSSNPMEIQRMRYGHIERMFVLIILAVIAVGGIVSMVHGNDKGLTILMSIVSLFGGYAVGVKRSEAGVKKSGSSAGKGVEVGEKQKRLTGSKTRSAARADFR
jgi:hypothetical protein